MKTTVTVCSLLLFLNVKAQDDTRVVNFTGDTLFLSSGQKIIKGQSLEIGSGKAENGWYHSIGLKHLYNILLLINRESDIKYQYNGRGNPEQERENDLVRTSLTPDKLLFVKGIKRRKEKHADIWYSLTLVQKSFPETKFYSNIDSALKYRELIIP